MTMHCLHVFSLIAILQPAVLQGMHFKDLLQATAKHPEIQRIDNNFRQKTFAAKVKATLQDPILKYSLPNAYTNPLHVFSKQQLSISQQIPLTPRLWHMSRQAKFLRQAGAESVDFKKAQMKSQLWQALAMAEAFKKNMSIVKESISWLQEVRKSAQRLYATGKIDQTVLLMIEVREADMKQQAQDLLYKLAASKSTVSYVAGRPVTDEFFFASIRDVPWHILEQKIASTNANKDSFEKALNAQISASEAKLKATKLSYIPDVVLGSTYSAHEDKAHTLAFFAQIPIPLWGAVSRKINAANSEFLERRAALADYRLQTASNKQALHKKIQTLKNNQAFITTSISHLQTEIELATRKDAFGSMETSSLLDAELRFRDKKIKKEEVTASVRVSQTELLLLYGDSLDVDM